MEIEKLNGHFIWSKLGSIRIQFFHEGRIRFRFISQVESGSATLKSKSKLGLFTCLDQDPDSASYIEKDTIQLYFFDSGLYI